MDKLPYGWSIWARESICGGYDRPSHRVENEEEIRLGLGGSVEPRLECGYCGDPCPTRDSVAKALRWWHAHDCKPLEAAEAAGIVYDLGAVV